MLGNDSAGSSSNQTAETRQFITVLEIELQNGMHTLFKRRRAKVPSTDFPIVKNFEVFVFLKGEGESISEQKKDPYTG